MAIEINSVIEHITKKLNDLGIKYELALETPLWLYGITNVMFPTYMDVLIDQNDLHTIMTQYPVVETEKQYPYVPVTIDGLLVRFWTTINGYTISSAKKKFFSPEYQCYATEPDTLLELLPSSPDSCLLDEQIAQLALVLHYDELTKDELELFHRYVRI